jgi:hypothetical protein
VSDQGGVVDMEAWVRERLADGVAQDCAATVLVVFHKDHEGFVRQLAEHPSGSPKLNVSFAGPGAPEKVMRLLPPTLLYAFLLRSERFKDDFRHVRNEATTWLTAFRDGLRRRMGS